MTANLLSMLQGLTAPDREVDALIEIEARRQQAYQVGLNDKTRAKWVPFGTKGEVEDGHVRYHSPSYTFSLDATVALCERVLPGYDWIVGHTNGGLTIHAQVGQNEMVFGETPAIALLIAILTALEDRENG